MIGGSVMIGHYAIIAGSAFVTDGPISRQVALLTRKQREHLEAPPEYNERCTEALPQHSDRRIEAPDLHLAYT